MGGVVTKNQELFLKEFLPTETFFSGFEVLLNFSVLYLCTCELGQKTKSGPSTFLQKIFLHV